MNIDQVIVRKGTLDDLLFRGKNKAYGAYFLRKVYPEHIKKSLILFLVLVSAIAGIYKIYDVFKDKVKFNTEKPIKKVTELKAPPPLEDKKTPPPPPPPPPPPVKSTIQFVPPKIVEVAAPEEEIKTVEEVVESKSAVSTATVKGQDLPEEIGLQEEKGNGPVEAPKSAEPVLFADVMPEFPGGEDALAAYLSKNIRYPSFAQEQGLEGQVFINFVVNEDGSVTNARIVKGNKTFDDEALRVVRGMPRWKPGKMGEHAVKVYYDLPVTFRLEE